MGFGAKNENGRKLSVLSIVSVPIKRGRDERWPEESGTRGAHAATETNLDGKVTDCESLRPINTAFSQYQRTC